MTSLQQQAMSGWGDGDLVPDPELFILFTDSEETAEITDSGISPDYGKS